jgi:ribonuclease P/MRP protein subunit POP5
VSPPRERHRYVAFRVGGGRAFRRDEVLEAIRRSGARVWLVEYRDGLGLVRCGHLDKDATIAALRAIERIGEDSAAVTTLGTSGTIRKATEKYLRPRRESHPTDR